jgi:hypothetical protein
MNTSPREERTVAKTVSVDKEQELETRLALHEFYAMGLPLYERKMERIRKYMADLRSPEVDFATLMSNSLLDEDNLRWVEEDGDLLAMAYPEWQRPAWVKRFEGK